MNVEQLEQKKWELTDEGRTVAESGSHEAVVYNAVPPQGILQSHLTVCKFSLLYATHYADTNSCTGMLCGETV